MKFKTTRQLHEFESGNMSWNLIRLLQLTEYYMLAKYKHEITITEIYRSAQEQDGIYGHLESYKKKPWPSTHQFWRAADIRTRDMEREWVIDLAEVLNRIPYDPKRPEKKTCVYHDVGKGYHCHIQTMEP